MTSVNPAPGRPQRVGIEKERSIEELPPMHHKEQLELKLKPIAAPHIDPETLKIIRQHLEEKSTK